MTKKQALIEFKDMGLHLTNQINGYPDIPARREDWNNFVDMLEKDGRITDYQAFIWNNPF